ncbi:RcnB family protein [Vannielia sp.]|uniref:RcnB family protein n=1 Tax=Vannielia sp. TaxID=2813045 RepID=UPI002613A186|nr:RcnB family protein [Vannielia sp.]MDF1871561.1 RcnB family protein [Vannielia sp.]
MHTTRTYVASGTLACLMLPPPALAQTGAMADAPAQKAQDQNGHQNRHQGGRGLATPAIQPGTPLEGTAYKVVDPWRYGLEPAPQGSDYVVLDGQLLLMNTRTTEVITLLRALHIGN